MSARKPIRVFFSPLSHRFYATRTYDVESNGFVTCTGEKFDVTNDIAEMVNKYALEFVERKPMEALKEQP